MRKIIRLVLAFARRETLEVLLERDPQLTAFDRL
jgi:hypothetical protein